MRIVKLILRLVTYSVYLVISSLKFQQGTAIRPNFVSNNVSLVSSRGISSSTNSGNASLLEFTNIFRETLSQKTLNNMSFIEYFKSKDENLNILIVRDFISFVFVDLIRIFFRRDIALIYYSTDVMFNRLPPFKFSLLKKTLVASISILEKRIWSRADWIFTNRADECQLINDINKNIELIPAKSRIPNQLKPKLPDYNKELKFIFVGISSNIPNQSSINTFINIYLPKIANKYHQSKLLVVGANWDKYITPDRGIELMGFLTTEELLAVYKDADFSISYLDYGAGVKGKVLEAMENNTIVLGNTVAFEGIECSALISFQEPSELLNQIDYFQNELNYKETLNIYSKFLSEQYSKQLIEDGIISCLQKMAKES